MRRYLRVTLRLAVILSTLASTVHAERRLKDHLGGSRALPPAGERIAFAEKTENDEPRIQLLLRTLVLVRFAANPIRLWSIHECARTNSRVLIDGGVIYRRAVTEPAGKMARPVGYLREHSRCSFNWPDQSALKHETLVDAEPENKSFYCIRTG